MVADESVHHAQDEKGEDKEDDNHHKQVGLLPGGVHGIGANRHDRLCDKMFHVAVLGNQRKRNTRAEGNHP